MRCARGGRWIRFSLTDVQMPVMGIEACQRISQRKSCDRNAKIVFVTACISSEFDRDCRNVGAEAVLLKPLSTEELDALL